LSGIAVETIHDNIHASRLQATLPPLLSFFTGAGFLDLGFLQAGFQVVWRNEYDTTVVEGYEFAMSGMGLPATVENTRSITDIGPNEIADQAFNGLPRPAEFGVIGGPPCPDFSVGGKNRGRHGVQGRLSQIYLSRIVELQPTFFLFENVPGLYRTAKHREYLGAMLELVSRDYFVDYRILNALDYGVPQDRSRLFVIGLHRRWLRQAYGFESPPWPFDWFPWPYDSRYAGAKTRFKWPTVTPLGETPPKPPGIPDELMVGPLIADFEETSALRNGLEFFRPRSPKFGEIAEGDVSRKSFKRLHRWRFSPTAAYGNNEVHLHPIMNRRLTVREALRIQSVPDAYALPSEMPLSRKFKTIGNGVPVKLAFAVACSIATVLRGG